MNYFIKQLNADAQENPVANEEVEAIAPTATTNAPEAANRTSCSKASC